MRATSAMNAMSASVFEFLSRAIEASWQVDVGGVRTDGQGSFRAWERLHFVASFLSLVSFADGGTVGN